MTPQQEARLLRARAKTLRAEVGPIPFCDHCGHSVGDHPEGKECTLCLCNRAIDSRTAHDHAILAEADALDAVANELEAVAVVAGARSGDGQDHSRAYDAAYWTEQRCRFSGNGHAGCFAAPLNRHGGPCVPCWTRALARLRELERKP